MDDNHTLLYRMLNCKYHIVFASKYRKHEFYGNNMLEIGKIIIELCKWKKILYSKVKVKLI